MPLLQTKHQRRVCKLDIKAIHNETKDANGITIGQVKGYASVFGKVDWYDDVVQAGAFTKTIQERSNVKVLWQHDPQCPIGKPTVMKEDAHGLYVEFDLNLETEKGREAYALLKQGAIDGISIGFETIKDEMDRNTGIRTIVEVRLWEFSVVTFPAQESAMVTDVRNMKDADVVALARYERARLGLKDMGAQIKTALKTKEVSNTVLVLDGVIEELMALRESLDSAAAEDTTEPAGDGYSDETAREVYALLAGAESLIEKKEA